MNHTSRPCTRSRLALSAVAVLVTVAGFAVFATEAPAQWGYGTWNRGYYVPRQMRPIHPPRRMPTRGANQLQHRWELPKPVGTIVSRPPDGAIARRLPSGTFFCHGPDFYIQMKDGFMVAVPPIGGTMNRAPLGAARMHQGGREYFYYNGVFVTKGPEGFEVVPSPVGAIVHRIPPVAHLVTAGKEKYYVVTGTYFERVFRGGTVAYRVVPPPKQPDPKPAEKPSADEAEGRKPG
jgi:hypothetical protein